VALTEEEKRKLAELQTHNLRPRKLVVAGILSAIFMVSLLTTTHENYTEWVFAIGTAVAIIAVMVGDRMLRKMGWRR
jgi:branched-subunit amino acid transport protein